MEQSEVKGLRPVQSTSACCRAPCAGVGTVYVMLSLPETKGLSLTEVQALLQRRSQRPPSGGAFTLDEHEGARRGAAASRHAGLAASVRRCRPRQDSNAGVLC